MIFTLPLLAALSTPATAEPVPATPVLTPAAVQEEAEESAPKWTGSISVGANWSGGNTRTTGINGTADAEYRRTDDRTTLGALYTYSKNRATDVVDDDRYGARAQYDYFFSEKTYGLVQTSYDVDVVADLRSRVTAGAGMGRQFREDDTLKLSGEAGLTWKDEEFPHGQGGDDIAARLAYNVNWNPNEAWEFGQSTTVLPVIDDLDDVLVTVDTRVKATLTQAMFAQLQWLFEHDETPASGKDETDHRVLFSLGWSF